MRIIEGAAGGTPEPSRRHPAPRYHCPNSEQVFPDLPNMQEVMRVARRISRSCVARHRPQVALGPCPAFAFAVGPWHRRRRKGTDMRIAETVTFGGSGLDRAAHLRADPKLLAGLLGDPAAGVLPVWRGKPLIDGASRGPVWLAPDHPVLGAADEAPVFLGLDTAAPRFAADISGWQPDDVPDTVGAFFDPSEQVHPLLPIDHAFRELRANMVHLDPRAAELVATAKALLGWHQTHGHCARCGARSLIAEAGWQRLCPACGARHFPRTDPVVIMLILSGNDVLLGRSPGWPDSMYSLLAGFVEPGESLEAAVRREVREEAGVTVGRVGYLASQPWPFPASLMIGCRGEATSREISVDPVELEDARWLGREEMLDVFAGRSTAVRPARPGSIAHFLISAWLADRLD